MSYDDVEIEDMEWNEDLRAFTYPCPCGDLFQITKVVHNVPHLGDNAAVHKSYSLCPTLIRQVAACRKSLLRERKLRTARVVRYTSPLCMTR